MLQGIEFAKILREGVKVALQKGQHVFTGPSLDNEHVEVTRDMTGWGLLWEHMSDEGMNAATNGFYPVIVDFNGKIENRDSNPSDAKLVYVAGKAE